MPLINKQLDGDTLRKMQKNINTNKRTERVVGALTQALFYLFTLGKGTKEHPIVRHHKKPEETEELVDE